jgi:hypothetical protein
MMTPRSGDVSGGRVPDRPEEFPDGWEHDPRSPTISETDDE